MPSWLIVILVIASLILLVYLAISWLRPKENTREQYALKCLTTSSALVIAGIGAISSRDGIADNLTKILALLLNQSPPDSTPAPLSEKMLIVVLVSYAIYLISKSHLHWRGAISEEEMDRKRMKRSTALLPQAIEEGRRILSRTEKWKVYNQQQRIDPVTIPDEPNLAWHDHIRELFELWYRTSLFNDGSDRTGWQQPSKCWIGYDRTRESKIVLFCREDQPTPDAIKQITKIAQQFEITGLGNIFVAIKGNSALLDVDNVRLISEAFLLDHIADFTDYQQEIVRRVEGDHFPGSTLTLKDIYSVSSVQEMHTGGRSNSYDLTGFFNSWSCQPPGQQIALLGEYGQGKSTAALMFTYDAIKSKFRSTSGRIPILLELRGKSPANLTAQELLGAWSQQYKLHAGALMKLLIAGRLILIFEGFDEMANVATPEARIAHFRSLWRFAYRNSKIVFTGRRNLFFEDQELKVAFRSGNWGDSTAPCKVLHLLPFDDKKIEISLRWTDSVSRAEILQAARTSTQIYDIVSRPSLLFIVARLWDELRPMMAKRRITSAQVIDRFITHSYERQAAKERELDFMVLTTTERRYFHEGLAVYMASRGDTNQITSTDLQAAIERLFAAYPDDVHISRDVLMETALLPLKKRYVEREEAIQAITTDVRTHGILVNDLSARGAFKFAHKSFYEILAAKAQAHYLLEIEPVFYNAIRYSVGTSMDYVGHSEEMMRFFSEFLVVQLKEQDNTAISINTFDLIQRTASFPSIVRIVLRNVSRLMLLFRYNHTWRKGAFVLGVIQAIAVLVIGFLSLVSKTEYGRELLLDIGIVLEPAAKNDISVSVWLLLVLALVQFGFMRFADRTFNNISRRSRIWCAVLLFSDQALHDTAGAKQIVDFLGKSAAEKMKEDLEQKYSVQFS
jgi:hypothetical protein